MIVDVITKCHDRHYPWCDKYNKNKKCDDDVITDVAKEEVIKSFILNKYAGHTHKIPTHARVRARIHTTLRP